MVRISVVMPVYNVQEYIETAVNSVLSQSLRDFELLIIDDESKDRSIELCKQFKDSRIKIIHQKNRGLAGARNTGIRNATGEFIAFLDSDDFWHPGKLQQHYDLMQKNSSCGFSFSASQFVNENGDSIARRQQPKRTKNYDAAYIFCRNPIGNGSSPVIRRDVLDQISFFQDSVDHKQYFDETLRQSEDVECWTRIALKTQTLFLYIQDPLTYYRVNNSGLSADVVKQLDTWCSILEKFQIYAPEFAKNYGKLAKAFQLRYLARRLVFQKQLFSASRTILSAIKTDKRILWIEPRKTFETLITSLGLCLFPASIQNLVLNRLLRINST